MLIFQHDNVGWLTMPLFMELGQECVHMYFSVCAAEPIFFVERQRTVSYRILLSEVYFLHVSYYALRYAFTCNVCCSYGCYPSFCSDSGNGEWHFGYKGGSRSLHYVSGLLHVSKPLDWYCIRTRPTRLLYTIRTTMRFKAPVCHTSRRRPRLHRDQFNQGCPPYTVVFVDFVQYVDDIIQIGTVGLGVAHFRCISYTVILFMTWFVWYFVYQIECIMLTPQWKHLDGHRRVLFRTKETQEEIFKRRTAPFETTSLAALFKLACTAQFR